MTYVYQLNNYDYDGETVGIYSSAQKAFEAAQRMTPNVELELGPSVGTNDTFYYVRRANPYDLFFSIMRYELDGDMS